MTTPFYKSRSFRTACWCLLGYALIFTVANFDVLTGTVAQAVVSERQAEKTIEPEMLADHEYYDEFNEFHVRRALSPDAPAPYNALARDMQADYRAGI